MPGAPVDPSGGPLPEAVIRELAPYVDEAALRRFRARTSAPWTWAPRLLRAGAVTLGHNVCFKPGLYRGDDARGLALIAHEAVHVRQYGELGTVPFLLRYGLGLFTSRFEHDRHPLELEPEAVQARVREELARAGT